MKRYAHIMGASMALVLSSLPVRAADDGCRLCTPSESDKTIEQQPERPLSIDIATDLDFSKAALMGRGSGEIKLDPDGSQRSVSGLIDLGGYATAGSAIVKGEPGRSVRIDMPAEVSMTSSTGGIIRISALQTNLPPAPRLDASGELKFSFGGRLEVSGAMAGTFRGRIAITANYE